MGIVNLMICAKNSNKSCEDETETIKKIINIKGTVVLNKKIVVDLNGYGASILDRVHEILGKRVSIQLISATQCDPRDGANGMIGKAAILEDWETKMKPTPDGGESSFSVTFEWEESMGIPGAFLISNQHHSQIYLKSVTLEDIPDHGTVYFVCNSWIYPTHRYKYSRIFFANKAYLPHSTPEPLRHYREQELINLRGAGSGNLKEWDRVYDYAYYNDLGLPDKGTKHARPVLGGSWEYPYPRRGRTGGRPNKSNPNTEAALMFVYVPPDERFSYAKYSDFSRNTVKRLHQMIYLEMKRFNKKFSNEFDTFGDILKLYEGGFNFRARQSLRQIRKHNHFKLANQLLGSHGDKPVMFPKPDVIRVNKSAWQTDEEFAREMLAGVNPVVIRRLKEFPPASKLDPQVYGNQTSSMTDMHLEQNMNGLTVEQALKENKLFILDHHDAWFPYLKRINSTQSKIYATRTVLLLQDDGTLKPLAIELSLPSFMEENPGCISRVYTPAENGVAGTIWQLAKAYAVVNDSGYHQIISHWLNTHAVIEPFVIAMNRQLSVLHPIYKLLRPHFRDTMNMNALTRKMLINAGGSFEMTISPGKYAMEMSSVIYKQWVFTEQALPADLLKRGVAVKDPREPHGVRMLIHDYPFAVDGLEIWSAIQDWVDEYCCIYYPSDEIVEYDPELQSWWMELKTKGHGDKIDEPWWTQMQTRAELINTCTIIIWVASALHAAVNFGQYPYAGYTPNRPCISRRFMPEVHELESDPEKIFLKTFTSRYQTLLGISLMEILSMHSTDEIYLGQNESPHWTSDNSALQAFERFGKKLVEIEERIMKRNKDERLKNRSGSVKVPYTLLCPNTSDYTHMGGLMGRGIPNSISI